MEKRKILHVDLDAFFASVEQLDNPDLRGKAVIVGGSSDRGVVATCSYEARRYGVHSAMSSIMAKKICPNCVFVKGRMNRYIEISKEVFDILTEITENIQKVSIDEAYLDITDKEKSPYETARWIKEQIKERIGITISIGISYNKFLAKLASDWNKPDGIFEIHEKDVPDILKPLSILKVHGLGKKTAKKLNNIGIYKIEDLLQYNKEYLSYFLGKSRAEEVYNRIRGIDERPVKTTNPRKSYGRETTFKADTNDINIIKDILSQYLFEISFKLVKEKKTAKTVTVKIKYEDFEQITRSHSLPSHTSNMHLFEEALDLIIYNLSLEKKVRLAGISLSNIATNDSYQLSLFD
jgi:DNA polymerase-4